MPELTWVGKSKVITHHLDVPYRVLDRQYSFDETGQHDADNGSQNMIIHGDNLEALKALLPKYEGKVDVIYIDPPYNTGNEGWVYNDNVNDPRIKKWLGEVVGKEGEDLSRHDKWLCMMYPRLRLLHKLLSRGGVIFISIDDNECANLKLICDEIFGAINYTATLAIGNNKKGRSDQKYFATAHESLMVYRRSDELSLGGFEPEEHITKRYNKSDSDGRRWREIDLRKTGNNDRRQDRPNMFYPFYWDEDSQILSLDPLPNAVKILPYKSASEEGRWRWGVDSVSDNIDRLYARFMPAKKQWSVFEKDYLDSRGLVKPTTLWLDKSVNTERGSEQLSDIFGKRGQFDYPKPLGFIELILSLVTKENPIILDSFAGSGTTAHAVMKLNQEDGGNRKFILVELGDYAETITAERCKRVINGYGEGKKAVPGTGGSFSFYELGEPLLVGDNLNPAVGVEKIREYIWFTETRSPLPGQSSSNQYFLGTHANVAYYFYYEPDQATTLDWDFLPTLDPAHQAESYVVYADTCTISEEERQAHGIVFKKIPRDITRL